MTGPTATCTNGGIGTSRGHKSMRWISALFALLFLSACALEPDYIEVRAPAPAATAPLAGAERVSLAVEVRDNRQIRDRVSNKINAYGMEMAPIFATNDVLAEAREAIVIDLRSRGFSFDGADARLEMEFTRFYGRFITGFWSGTASGEIILNLRVVAPDGRLIFARSYNAEGLIPRIQLASGENARTALDAALARLVRMVGDDQELLRTLLSMAPPQRGRVGV